MILILIAALIPVIVAWRVGCAMAPAAGREPEISESPLMVRSYDRHGNLIYARRASKVDIYT